MQSVKGQVMHFLDKCEEMRNCKFIMATTKIKDVLKAIVNSAELYDLFNTVVSKFDYNAAKQRYLVSGNNGVYSANYVVLPDTVGERLAFIFCLLVEFDRDEINFNDFLRRYYHGDGSYYASYHAFCDDVVVSLENIIKDIYSREIAEGEQRALAERATADADARTAGQISYLGLLISRERDFIGRSSIDEDDKVAADKMLEQLAAAVKACDRPLIEALSCGYNYFVSYFNIISDDAGLLFSALSEFMEEKA